MIRSEGELLWGCPALDPATINDRDLHQQKDKRLFVLGISPYGDPYKSFKLYFDRKCDAMAVEVAMDEALVGRASPVFTLSKTIFAEFYWEHMTPEQHKTYENKFGNFYQTLVDMEDEEE
jgi:hypothetical protein